MGIKISVIMPVYNKKNYLKKSIGSVLDSDFDDYELLCIDDASTDGSVEVLEEFKKKNDKIKLLYNECNCGAAFSRNKGIETARGRYIVFLDADDHLSKNALKEYYRLMEYKKAEMCFLKFANKSKENHTGIVNAYHEVYTGMQLLDLFVQNDEEFMFACGAVYGRSFIVENGLCFENLKIGEGGLFVLQALLKASRVIVSDYAGYFYNINESSTSRQAEAMSNSANGQLRQILFMFKNLTDDSKYMESKVHFLDWYIKKNIGGILNLSRVDRGIISAGGSFDYDELMINLLRGSYFFKKIEIEKKIEEEIVKKGKVYLYGAGYEILSVIRYCHHIGIEIIKVFVSSLNGNTNCAYGYKIHEFSADKIPDLTVPVIIAAHKKHQGEIKKILEEAGVKYIASI